MIEVRDVARKALFWTAMGLALARAWRGREGSDGAFWRAEILRLERHVGLLRELTGGKKAYGAYACGWWLSRVSAIAGERVARQLVEWVAECKRRDLVDGLAAVDVRGAGVTLLRKMLDEEG